MCSASVTVLPGSLDANCIYDFSPFFSIPSVSLVDFPLTGSSVEAWARFLPIVLLAACMDAEQYLLFREASSEIMAKLWAVVYASNRMQLVVHLVCINALEIWQYLS